MDTFNLVMQIIIGWTIAAICGIALFTGNEKVQNVFLIMSPIGMLGAIVVGCVVASLSIISRFKLRNYRTLRFCHNPQNPENYKALEPLLSIHKDAIQLLNTDETTEFYTKKVKVPFQIKEVTPRLSLNDEGQLCVESDDEENRNVIGAWAAYFLKTEPD